MAPEARGRDSALSLIRPAVLVKRDAAQRAGRVSSDVEAPGGLPRSTPVLH